MADILQLRGGSAAAWTSANPILADREVGVETDTKKLKIGNGTSSWNSLSYMVTSAQDAFYEHTQSVAALQWNIVHNMSKYPSVSIVINNEEVEADITYIDANNIRLDFSSAYTGKAYLS
jgi:hypothetical protein